MEFGKGLDLGTWLGKRQAFALITSKCSAGEAECLKKIRDAGTHRAMGLTWEQFCQKHFGISRSYADRIIQQLQEFGETYFQLTQLMQMSPNTYRQIAPAVTAEAQIEYNGEKIAICRENSAKIVHAVAQLRRQSRQPAANRRLSALRKRFDAWLAELAEAQNREAVAAMLSGHVAPALDNLLRQITQPRQTES